MSLFKNYLQFDIMAVSSAFVTAVALLTIGVKGSTAQNSCLDIGVPYDLHLVSTNDLTVITWNEPEYAEICHIQYRLQVLVNNELIRLVTLENDYYSFEGLTLCSTLTISLIAFSVVSGSRSKEVTKQLSTEIVTINNLGVENGIASWNVPAGSTCLYQIQLNDDIIEEAINDTSFDLSTAMSNGTACTQYKLKVTPIHFNGTSGIARDYAFISEINTPTGLHIVPTENVVVITWTRPQNAGDCDFHYEIKIYVNGNIILGNNVYEEQYIFDGPLNPCSVLGVNVTAVSSSLIRSKTSSKEIFAEPGQLEDFEIKEDYYGNIGVYWSSKFSQCVVLVQYEDILYHFSKDYGTFYENTLNYCVTYTVYARTFGNGKLGQQVTYSFRREPRKLENFKLEYENDRLIASWSRRYEQCIIGLEINQQYNYTGNYVEIDEDIFDLCVSANGYARAFDEELGLRGEAVQFEFEKRVNWKRDFFTFKRNGTEMVALWSNNFNSCSIEVIVLYAYDVYTDLTNGTALNRTQFDPNINYGFFVRIISQAGKQLDTNFFSEVN